MDGGFPKLRSVKDKSKVLWSNVSKVICGLFKRKEILEFLRPVEIRILLITFVICTVYTTPVTDWSWLGEGTHCCFAR